MLPKAVLIIISPSLLKCRFLLFIRSANPPTHGMRRATFAARGNPGVCWVVETQTNFHEARIQNFPLTIKGAINRHAFLPFHNILLVLLPTQAFLIFYLTWLRIMCGPIENYVGISIEFLCWSNSESLVRIVKALSARNLWFFHHWKTLLGTSGGMMH